jgi:3-dehydro-L-gulonate 2-dehydrogenase
MNTNEALRVSFDDMKQQFHSVLLKLDFIEEKASTIARIFAENSLDGVYSHGANRFPRFVQYVRDGHVQKDNEPTLTHSFGSIEQWNGNAGPGILNALHCAEKAMALASANGIGCIGLANTNHWMRGGTYGWHAARKGFAMISWTNTITVMPAWGALEAKLGNNPFVIALPYKDEAIVLDMAMSQFSYGKMEMKAASGEALNVAGGFDKKGQLTTNAAEVLESRRPLSIGYWKGSGLALLLDILAAIISGGQATRDISASSVETNVSQVFIAIDLKHLHNNSSIADVLQNIINDYASAEPDGSTNDVRFPGEGVVRTRTENLEKGIPVSKKVWDEILSL